LRVRERFSAAAASAAAAVVTLPTFLTGGSPMKSVLIAGLAAASLMLGGVAQASEAKANEAGCLKCHGVDKKKMGSALKDIAAKNKGNKDYVVTAVEKLKSGKGHPKSAASDADLKLIMEWVMTL
jgi:cytochrome c